MNGNNEFMEIPDDMVLMGADDTPTSHKRKRNYTVIKPFDVSKLLSDAYSLTEIADTEFVKDIMVDVADSFFSTEGDLHLLCQQLLNTIHKQQASIRSQKVRINSLSSRTQELEGQLSDKTSTLREISRECSILKEKLSNAPSSPAPDKIQTLDGSAEKYKVQLECTLKELESVQMSLEFSEQRISDIYDENEKLKAEKDTAVKENKELLSKLDILAKAKSDMEFKIGEKDELIEKLEAAGRSLNGSLWQREKVRAGVGMRSSKLDPVEVSNMFYEKCMSADQIAQQLGCSRVTVYRALKKRKNDKQFNKKSEN